MKVNLNNCIYIFIHSLCYAIGGFIFALLLIYIITMFLTDGNLLDGINNITGITGIIRLLFIIFAPICTILGVLIAIIKIQPKKITLGLMLIWMGLALNWIFVLILGLLGILFTQSKVRMLAIPFIITSIIISPLFNKLISSKFNFKLSMGVKIMLVIMLVIMLLILCIFYFPWSDM